MELASGAVRVVLAAVLLPAALAVPSSLGRSVRLPVPLAPVQATGPQDGGGEPIREALLVRMEDELYSRMPAAPPALHEAVARALIGEAKAVQVDPLLVLAMIEVESGFDPLAASSAGARGLMQLLPATMQREAAALGLGGADPSDPIVNVRAGVRYLRRCLDAYPGHLDLALMAYNSGPNRVLEFLEDGEVPGWASAYPERVEQAWRRVRKAFAAEPGARLAEAGAPPVQ